MFHLHRQTPYTQKNQSTSTSLNILLFSNNLMNFSPTSITMYSIARFPQQQKRYVVVTCISIQLLYLILSFLGRKVNFSSFLLMLLSDSSDISVNFQTAMMVWSYRKYGRLRIIELTVLGRISLSEQRKSFMWLNCWSSRLEHFSILGTTLAMEEHFSTLYLFLTRFSAISLYSLSIRKFSKRRLSSEWSTSLNNLSIQLLRSWKYSQTIFLRIFLFSLLAVMKPSAIFWISLMVQMLCIFYDCSWCLMQPLVSQMVHELLQVMQLPIWTARRVCSLHSRFSLDSISSAVLITIQFKWCMGNNRIDMSGRIPFVNTRNVWKVDDTFLGLIHNAVCPHFQLVSWSSLFLGICLVVFIIMHIIYPPGGYSLFLQLPTQMETLCLNIHAFQQNKAKFYTLFTAMFIHYSYSHIVVNTVFGIFIMYELEYCWKWSILAALVAGIAANCLAVVTMNGLVLGFSGVICACVGIIIAALILHCSYLRAMYSGAFYCVFCFMILLLILVIGISPAGVVHLFGILFGLLFGLALYPVIPQAQPNPNVQKLFKIFSAAFLVLAVILAFTA